MDDRPYHHGDLPNTLRRAAAELVAERGAAGFSLREVARRAGVSHAAPSHHFGDSTGLLTAVAVEAFQHLHAAMTAAMDGVDDPVERLARIGRAYVEVSLSSPGHCAVVYRHDLVDADNPDYRAWGDKAHGVLNSTIQGLRDELNPDLDVEIATDLCWAAMQGLIQLYPNMANLAAGRGKTIADIGDLAEQYAHHLAGGLTNPIPD